MKPCIVKAHNAGLFSLLNNVITCLDKSWRIPLVAVDRLLASDKYDYVSVDWTGSIYGEGDLWPVLFSNLSVPKYLDAETVTGYEDQWLTYKNAGQLYLSGDEWRIKCHKLWSLLTVQQQIRNNVERFPMLNQFRGKVVAALIRAHGHAGEQLSGHSQTLEQYAEAIEAEHADHLYIACQDEETIHWFLHGSYSWRRPIMDFHPFAKRSPSRDIDRHLVEPQTPRDAIVVLEEALIMSHADVLVHGVSNIATAVLYMNPNVKSVFLQ